MISLSDFFLFWRIKVYYRLKPFLKASFQRVSDNNKHHKNIPRIHVLWDGCRWNKSMKWFCVVREAGLRLSLLRRRTAYSTTKLRQQLQLQPLNLWNGCRRNKSMKWFCVEMEAGLRLSLLRRRTAYSTTKLRQQLQLQPSKSVRSVRSVWQ